MKTLAMYAALAVCAVAIIFGAAAIVGVFCGVTIRVARWVVEA